MRKGQFEAGTSSVARAMQAEHVWAEKKDIILRAVGSDDKSLIVDFQGWILYEWENTCAHTHKREKVMESDTSWISNTETNSASARHTEVPCYTLKPCSTESVSG